MQREVIDVNEINRETVALLRSEAGRYNISIRTELADDVPHGVGDRVQLQQVAMNLIVNSIEAVKDVDGIREIVIKSRRGEDDQILVSVSDTGIGFSPQLAELAAKTQRIGRNPGSRRTGSPPPVPGVSGRHPEAAVPSGMVSGDVLDQESPQIREREGCPGFGPGRTGTEQVGVAAAGQQAYSGPIGRRGAASTTPE
jgi:hypothetical protein